MVLLVCGGDLLFVVMIVCFRVELSLVLWLMFADDVWLFLFAFLIRLFSRLYGLVVYACDLLLVWACVVVVLSWCFIVVFTRV